MSRLGLRLTPQGRLLLEAAEDAPVLDDKLAERLAKAFSLGSGHGLLRLGASEIGQALPPAFAWWRDFAARYVGALCGYPAGAPEDKSPALPTVQPPSDGELATLSLTAPMMPGSEYLTADVMLGLWAELGRAFATALAEKRTDLQSFLKALNPA